MKPARLSLLATLLLSACSTGTAPTTAASANTSTTVATATTTAGTTTTTVAAGTTPTTTVVSTTTTGPAPTPLADIALSLEWVAGGFPAPVFILSRASANGAAGDDRMFVVDQTGTITGFAPPEPGVVPRDRAVVLDISSKVAYGGERGLLGVAFHPDSPDRMFVDYTRDDGATVIEEYSFPVGADAAESTPVRTILVQPQPAANHNGGMIAFGPDRYLYVALGDGGGGGDTYGNGQDPHTLLGAILRLDVDGGTPYAIPPDNPFADGVAGAPEVWLWGLRNPWRFSFDGADLWIGDVGQNAWEEIDAVGPDAGGSNLGWPIFEGTHCYDGPCDDPSGFTPPVLEYPHGGGRCSITGGYVYRGAAIPDLKGVYLYGDYCSGEIMALRYSGGSVVDSRVWDPIVAELTSFGVDRDGNLYVTAWDSVYRVVVG